MRTLYVFTNDLRLDDNPALKVAAESAASLMCLYCYDPSLNRAGQFDVARMSPKRDAFLGGALLDLSNRLQALGNRLIVLNHGLLEGVATILGRYDIDQVIYSQPFGVYERRQWGSLADRYKMLTFRGIPTFTLFQHSDLPFEALPASFSKFRREIEKLSVPVPIAPPEALPKVIQCSFETALPAISETNKLAFQGGETAAQRRSQDYFSTVHPSTYKETRNALEGNYHSTRLSAWLSNGNLSARRVHHQVSRYESVNGANDSTYWIQFELYWREFFQWYAHEHKDKLFRFGGLNDKAPLTSFYPQRFKQWCQGQTPWPLVNASMLELNETGYLSNRARQIVASCLVNELSCDWRAGAAYFEAHLLDYDVASNWGNWQYIAGVGADPRGGRHFNIDKQTAQFDPKGDYVRRWVGDKNSVMKIDSVDAADWPIQ